MVGALAVPMEIVKAVSQVRLGVVQAMSLAHCQGVP